MFVSTKTVGGDDVMNGYGVKTLQNRNLSWSYQAYHDCAPTKTSAFYNACFIFPPMRFCLRVTPPLGDMGGKVRFDWLCRPSSIKKYLRKIEINNLDEGGRMCD